MNFEEFGMNEDNKPSEGLSKKKKSLLKKQEKVVI